MTRRQVEQQAQAYPPGERRRIWTEVCPTPHDVSRLPFTDDGYRYCQYCSCVWEGHLILNVPERAQEIHLATSASPELLAALGAVEVNFCALEDALGLSIWFLLGDFRAPLSEQYQIVMSQLSFHQLLTIFANLYRRRFPAESAGDALASLTSACEKAATNRNRLIHPLWVEGRPAEDNLSRAERLKLISQLKRF